MPLSPERWAERAHYDLETAQAMLDSGRFLYVLFCCQQAVEKMIKALIIRQTGELPPRIHNLIQLAAEGNLELTPERGRFFRKLGSYYVQSRYPEEIETGGKFISRHTAAETLKRTGEIIQWLSSLM